MLDKKVVSQCISADYCRGWNDAVDAIPRWISVEERLPEPLTDVVVIVRHGDGWQYTIGYVLNEEWHRTGGSRNFYYGGKITHWLPLPELPKEDGNV